ncbi:hypothetical protein QR680_009070 [Steinernema hermaphroditum]|uniref:GPI ethanolamine phosphate transferase 1 n=1 Tax=Steinernema hermaphroditum TaxID=289476 RepID=A0AA39IL11_9BILA|nr:hypothetical protein QR680_009070 [Steinernema hermaphroditum]
MLAPFVSLGVFVHLVLIYSIFDVYYTSPLVKGTTPHPISQEVGLADRLVLFSADGLRSRTFFEHPEKAPFLQDIIRNGKGSWGVSLSHVPTESRPGHVAMAAGFYEDVSAIAYGWKHNPVPFDSIFNRSVETWSWGSPDILPMFAENNPHIHTFTYSSEEEDFARKDASSLDVWVFDHLQKLFESARTDESLAKRLRAKKIVFFLHLLGLDSNGHGYKPHSQNYIDNIRIVDEGIQRVVKLFNDFYGDKRTAFLFTADHGMTDWGSHGSGTDDEIVTPLVAWGSGVAESAVKRTVNQVDLGPLMAALLGCAIPLNSVGILPLDMLSGSERYRFQAARANLRQMADQYYVKREERQKHSLPFLFKDYPEFSFSVLSKLDSGLMDIAKRGQFNNAASIAISWIPRIRDALLYFHRYQRRSLGFAIASTFIAWISLIYSLVVRSSSLPPLDHSFFRPNKAFCIVMLVASLFLLLQRLPFTNFIYVMMPIWLFSITHNIRGTSIYLRDALSNYQQGVELYQGGNFSSLTTNISAWFLRLSLSVIVTSTFVISFTNRAFLSLITLLMIAYPKLTKTEHLKRWTQVWNACCIALSLFPQLDTVGNSPSPFLCFCAPLLTSAGLFVISQKMEQWKTVRILSGFHAACAALIALANLTESVPWTVSFCAWASLPMAFVLPTTPSSGIIERLTVWGAAFSVPYSLLSLAYESVFLILYAGLLGVFVRLEMSHLSDLDFLRISFTSDSSRKRSDSRMDDIHGSFSLREWYRAVMLVAFILLGFFGTGNIASLNSFNPSFLRLFLTVFSPFTMAALLIVKIAIPFALVAFAYTTILHQDRRGVPRLSILVLIITNTMAMIFFFFLKDDGSWLDIGMSISNYLISLFASLFIFLLLHGANLLFPVKFVDLSVWFRSQKDGTAV